MSGLLNLGERRVLVVEDDRAVSELLRIRLSVVGLDVRVAADGTEALKQVKEFRPDAMVLDLNMPRMDGFGVMKALAPAQMARLPTLVLTGRHAAEDVRKAIGLGARDYLAKPIDEDKFLPRIARLLRKPTEPTIRPVVRLEPEEPTPAPRTAPVEAQQPSALPPPREILRSDPFFPTPKGR